MRPLFGLALALGMLLGPPPGAAQAPLPLEPEEAPEARAEAFGVMVERGAPAERVSAWSDRLPPDPEGLERALRAERPVGTVAPERLAVLARIEGALAIARAAAARLEEGVALSALSQAARLAEAHLDIPGMASWYAEVQLAVALTATQAGLTSLGEAALARAASVDPTRGVLAAEARPEVVARARRAYGSVATAAQGRFEVRADVPGAVLYLDDRRLGRLPRELQTTVGPHVLRVEAPGHHPWARLTTVLEGDRPPMDVSLSPEPALRGARRAVRDAARGAVERLPDHLSLAPGLSLSLLYPSRTADRALRVRCDAEGCGDAERLRPDLRVEGGSPLAAGLDWLDAPPHGPPVEEDAWWQRWELWTAVGGGLVAAAIVVAALASPQGEPPLVVVVDPRGL